MQVHLCTQNRNDKVLNSDVRKINVKHFAFRVYYVLMEKENFKEWAYGFYKEKEK